MRSSAISVIISIFCFLNGSRAQLIPEETIFFSAISPIFTLPHKLPDQKIILEKDEWIHEFTNTLLFMSRLNINKTDESYRLAKTLLKTNVDIIEKKCIRIKDLSWRMRSFFQFFVSIISHTMTPNVNWLSISSDHSPEDKAGEIWENLFEIFSRMSECIPMPKNISWNFKVTATMVAVVSKKIAKRLQSYNSYFQDYLKCSGEKQNNCLESSKSLLYSKLLDLPLLHRLLIPLAPLLGTCTETFEQRNCLMKSSSKCSATVREWLKTFFSPPFEVPHCPDFSNIVY